MIVIWDCIFEIERKCLIWKSYFNSKITHLKIEIVKYVSFSRKKNNQGWIM